MKRRGARDRASACEDLLGSATPSLLGWNELPRGKAIFAVCADCGDGPETEQRIRDKIGFKPMADAGSA